MRVQVDRKITLARLKEELVPLIGVPPTGFIVYGISRYIYGEYEMEGLHDTLRDIRSGSEV